ncbi:protease II [Brucella inopinata]|nr:protease II [Brucella inopinata]
MSQAFPRPLAPHAPKHPASDTRHGITRTDDYAWLRAENWQEVFRDPSVLAPEIRAHLDAENAYQAALMKDTENLQKVLFAEMRGRIKEDDSSVPAKDGPYAYGVSYRTGGEQPYFIRTPRDGGPETILLDGDREGEGKAYFRLASADHAPNHNLLIWGMTTRDRNFTN